MNAKTLNALPKAEIQFIEPMYARLVNELPEGKEWLYEVKFDGYRCLAGKDSTGVALGRGEETFSQTSSRTSPKPVNGSQRTLY
jgi:ATP-dependent DNA ligase